MPNKKRVGFSRSLVTVFGHDEGTNSDFEFTNPDCQIPYREEEITYSNSGYGVGYNSCKHNIYEWNLYPGSILTQSPSVDNPVLGDTHVKFNHANFFVRNGRPSGVPYANDLTSLCTNFASDPGLNHRAFRAMVKRIRIPKYLSIMNFFVELKDFKRMFIFWSLRKGKLLNISSGFLNEEFGWKPFLQDVCSLLIALQEFHKRFKKWCAEEHKPHVTHYRKILTEDDLVPRVTNLEVGSTGADFALTPQGTPIAPLGLTYAASLQTYHLRAPELIATMKYTYWCEDALGLLKELSAFYDAFGVYWDPQVLWNAIPFSFLVDWFFEVGDWLHRKFSKPNLTVKLRVIDFCISVKADCLTEGAIKVPYNLENYNLDDPSTYSYHSYTDRSRCYLRNACIPYTDDPLQLLNPLENLKKIFLMLALGHNCARPRKIHGKRQKGFKNKG